MLLLPGHQHDLWHQYCADKLLTSQDLLYLSLVLILMYSVLLVWKKIFMVNTPLSQKEHYSGSLPLAACQDELLALHLAYIITELHSRKPLFSPGFYFSILRSFLRVLLIFWRVQPPFLTLSTHSTFILMWHSISSLFFPPSSGLLYTNLFFNSRT